MFLKGRRRRRMTEEMGERKRVGRRGEGEGKRGSSV